MKLLLRPTVITDEKLQDDFCVFHEGRRVGRIRLASERSWQGVVWLWHVNPPLPIPPWCNGDADSLEAAKVKFKAAWERFYASLTPEDIASWLRGDKRVPLPAPCPALLRTFEHAVGGNVKPHGAADPSSRVEGYSYG